MTHDTIAATVNVFTAPDVLTTSDVLGVVGEGVTAGVVGEGVAVIVVGEGVAVRVVGEGVTGGVDGDNVAVRVVGESAVSFAGAFTSTLQSLTLV